MIKFGSVSLLVAAVIAGGLGTPAFASGGEVTRLIERPDGTLQVVKAQDNFFNKAFIDGEILGEQREEVETFLDPIEAPVDQAATSQDDAPVTGIAASTPSRVNDQYRWDQWGLDWLKAEEAWQVSQGEGITVAVLDSGVYAEHQDFEGRVTHGYKATDEPAGDLNGHGTHVAGVIAAGANNNLDTAGIAPKVKIWDGRITGSNGKGTSTWMAEGIAWAVNAGVDVINISMTSNYEMPLVHSAIKEANARGITVVASAGNDKHLGSPLRYPAAYDEVIAVGAIRTDGTYALFSNDNDYIDVNAPGNVIAGLNRQGGVMYMSGTSQASPMTAGAVALLKAAKPEATIDEIQDALRSGARGEMKYLDILASYNKLGVAAPVAPEPPAQETPQAPAETPSSSPYTSPDPVAPYNPAPAPAPVPVPAPVAPRPAPVPAPAPQPAKPSPYKPNAPKPINPIRHFVRPER